MSGTKQILVEEKSSSRIISLNRPKHLNALSSEMVIDVQYRPPLEHFIADILEISHLVDCFLAYEKDPCVKLLILKGNGRAFCSGGDVAAVIRDIREGNWRLSAEYSREQFNLIYLIATARKPQVSIINGFVMGAGAGLSIHSRFRVATENSVFAMPENSLGLFPDIGSSYFLSRLPGSYGEFVGLTGFRLDGAEMLAYGLATHFVPSERLKSLEEALIEAGSGNPAIISAVLSKFAVVPDLKESSAFYRLKVINSCFSRRTVEEIISAVEREAAVHSEDWIMSIIDSFRKASPTSLKVSLRSIREGRLEGVGKCLVREYRAVSHVFKGEMSPDFVEGYRAILLDKDKNPKWSPSTVEQVTDSMVDKYFSKIDDPDWEDLKLPLRPNLPSYALAKL